jgi:peptide/nickel transport system permease protein
LAQPLAKAENTSLLPLLIPANFWNRFQKNKVAVAGGIIVLTMLLIAILAPVFSPYDPNQIDVTNILRAPGNGHLLGTDPLGRDVLSRMLWGSRISLMVGFVSVGISLAIGVVLGALSGYYGGWFDDVVMRFVDIMLSVPTLFLILAIIAVVGPSIFIVMLIIGITSWPGLTRLVRGEFLSLKESDYISAARALGAGDFRIIFRHILPNALSPVYVSAILRVAGAILTESGLSLLGLGVQPPTPSWGNILSAGKDNIEIAWWLSVFPGLAILITVLGYNLLGEGLRDALDPRLKE